jgi:hypothetical protein
MKPSEVYRAPVDTSKGVEVDENMKTNPKERVLKIIVKSKKYRHTLV